MVRFATIAAALSLSTASFGATELTGGGTFIASNGLTGTWEQTVHVTSIEGGFHVHKSNEFHARGESLPSQVSYDLIGNRQSMSVQINGKEIGKASCREDACFYDLGNGQFEVDTSLSMNGGNFKKIGEVKFNYDGEDIVVRYEGTLSLKN